MIIAMAHDIRVVLIKLADRLHNMRTLESSGAPTARRKSRARRWRSTRRSRIGSASTGSSRSSRTPPSATSTRPPTRRSRRTSPSTMAEREEYIRAVIGIFARAWRRPGSRPRSPGRPKHFYSIHRKMQEEGLHFDQIYDLVAFRIIVATVRECYEALGVVHANWKPMPGRFKDYIALPKVNMYQSLHTTVIGPRGQRMEVQIRTARDARGGRGGNRRALELQGGRHQRDRATPSASRGCAG